VDGVFDAMYAAQGRASVTPETLLKASRCRSTSDGRSALHDLLMRFLAN